MAKPAKDVFLNFLKAVDGDFSPPLSQKTDLQEYADKMYKNAELFCEYLPSGEIKGLVAMYANDRERQYAYITLVVVSSLHREQGIATRLLGEAISAVKGKWGA